MPRPIIMTRESSQQPILIFGPSGVGKSTAIQYARQVLTGVVFLPLDHLARQRGLERELIGRDQGICELLDRVGADRLLELAIEATTSLWENRIQRPVVIDVGAGFLDAAAVGKWLSGHTTIVFFAEPALVYDRMRAARGDQRTLAQYRSREFAPRRRRLYRQARFRIDADCGTPRELGERLVQLLHELLDTPIAARPAERS
jgi:shikimate kinase